MEARVAYHKRAHEQAISAAWHTAAFSGAAQNGKLKPLNQYLETAQIRGGEQLLGALMAMNRKGVKMKIERLH